MPHRPEKLLADIINAASNISTFMTDKTRVDFDGDLMLRSAVERQFEILGEALRRLAALDAELAGRISEHRRIIDFRNIIAHGYDCLDGDIVWQAINDKLPRLLFDAQALAKELDDSLGTT